MCEVRSDASLLIGVAEFLLSQGIMPAEDAFQIPRAVRQTCVGKRRVVSAPSRSSASVTASATPSPFSNSEQTVSTH